LRAASPPRWANPAPATWHPGDGWDRGAARRVHSPNRQLPSSKTGRSSRPRCRAALRFTPRAQVEGTRAAVGLARRDSISTQLLHPVSARDEQGGFVYLRPSPFLNNGQPLVCQREAELHRVGTTLSTAGYVRQFPYRLLYE